MNDSMQDGVPVEIRELLKQRTTYEDWLRKLDQVGSEYRPEVAERVRADYRKRLAGVSEELEGHRHELEASLESRRGRMQELTDAFDRQSAELEEAELRYKVGEFDEDTWEDRRVEYTDELEDIERELEQARAAVGELEEVLAQLGSSALEDVLRKNGVPWVGGDESAPKAPRAKALEAEAAPATERGAAAMSDVPDPAGSDDGKGLSDSPTSEPSDRADARTSVVEIAGEAARDERDEEEGAAEEREEMVAAEAAPEATVGAATDTRPGSRTSEEESDEYLDELEFLESLSLDDPDSFDAVSRMLEDEEDR